MRYKISWIIGKVTALLYLAAEGLLFWALIRTRMVPGLYLGILGTVLIGAAALLVWMTWNGRRMVRYIAGIFLSILLAGLCAVGFLYVNRTLAAADKITTVNTEVTEVGVYVRTENTDDFTQAAAGYDYGILSQLDRENTDKAVEQLKEELGTDVSPREYESLTSLADSLLNQETDAVIMNSAYLDVLEEIEGYEDIRSRIKEVTVLRVEAEITQNGQETEKENGQTTGTSAGGQSVFTVYISGVDSRSSELVSKSRSDVNILAVVNADTRQIALISTPRDYYVPLSISNGVPDKLTHAGIYGVQVSMDTLAMLYDTSIDYYFRVNFTGFKDIIDALGGITVVSDYTFDSGNVSGYHFEKGENYMDGDAALAFCRERYAFASGDNQRGKNQLAVIKGVLNKCLSADMLMNYTRVLDAVEDSFETSIPYDTISSLVRSQLSDGSAWNIVSYSVTGTGDRQVPYSMSQSVYVMIPDESTVETAREMIQTVRNGGIIEDP